MANEKFIQESSRCVFENDDILVTHDFMSYPDDTKEAVMGVFMIKDGKIIRMETGATPLN
jgi:GR25 family glycosyltransferase involved in LPS biosynthesis